jgi:hypothetical protein
MKTTKAQNQPDPIPAELKKILLQKVPPKVIDGLAKYIHDSWWEEKARQGFHYASFHKEFNPSAIKKLCDKCHLDMIPYEQLPESSKVFDKVTIETTLAGLQLLGYHVHPNPKLKRFDMAKWKADHTK